TDPAFQLDGQPLIDTQQLYFYGISQGGIEGGFYMALAPDSVRGVLGVGGMNFSLLIPRSTDAALFNGVVNPAYPDEPDRRPVRPLFQPLGDRGDAQGHLPHLLADPLPGTPVKKILMQVGLYDAQVTNLASTIQARSLGVPSLAPPIQSLFGIPEMAAP